jgi:hypothetical protein
MTLVEPATALLGVGVGRYLRLLDLTVWCARLVRKILTEEVGLARRRPES